jgi:hypothetical protein
MKKFYHFSLLFFIIFNFRVPLFHNSMMLALAIMLPTLLLVKNYLSVFIILLKTKYFFRLLAFSSLFIVWFAVFARLQGTYDYSFIARLVVLSVAIITAIVYLSITSDSQNRNNEYLLNLLFTVFAVQALIQISGLVNHNIFEFIQIFHNQNDIRAVSEIAKFGGLRGGALAGDLFFSLSISYGLVFFLYVKYIVDKERFEILDGVYLILYLVGMFTSARIGYVGVLIALAYFFMAKKIMWHTRLKSLLKLVIYSFVLLGTLYMLMPANIKDVIFERLLPFAFEFIYRYMDQGEFATASTSHLARDMFVYPSTLGTWLIGDGRVMGVDGSYYMHTDAGYSRILFYFGIYGVILLSIYQILFFPYRNYSYKDNNFLKNNYIKTCFLILLYILLINIKGLALGIIVPLNLIIIFSLFDIRQFYYKEDR